MSDISETMQISESLHGSSSESDTLTPDQQIQALQASLASRNFTTLFQGGIVGLVLGASTAWIVSRNVRRSPDTEEKEEENGEEDQTEE